MNKAKIMSGKDTIKSPLTPRLRFPEFIGEGEWTKIQLSKIATPVSERATDGDADAVLTLSAEHGVVAQGAYFGKKVAGDDVKRYIRIRNNDFVYNDRTTKTYKYGTIKRLSRHAYGIVSPIYKCFRFNYEEIPVFWECYFESGEHDAQLHSITNEGAKEGRFNISIKQFLSTHVYFPHKIEQQKIADCLSSIDERIAVEANKLDALKAHKNGLLKQLFPAEGETLPALRFPEFRDAGEWEEELIESVAEVATGNKDTQDKVDGGAYPFFVRSQQVESIDAYALDCEAVLTSGDGVGVGKNFHYIEGKFNFHQRVYCIYNFSENVSGKFFFYFFSEKFYKHVMKLSAKNSVDSVRRAMITELSIMIPSLKEQQRIADCLSSLDELISAQTQKIELLKAHKKGLMQQLFPEIDEAKV